MSRYILAIDQSTQGTKALIFDEKGALLRRADISHRQIINDLGWVEHDPEEIMCNTLQVVKDAVAKAGIDKKEIVALGISNQRETSVAWDRASGKPVCNAIVWQCARSKAITEQFAAQGHADEIKKKTGLQISPYFPAAKLAWIMRNIEGVQERAQRGEICMGTIDSWLVYNLTKGNRFQTDYSNASRTQLFNISALKWDRELLKLFGIPECCMAQVTDSNGDYGVTDLTGWLDQPIPICGVLGDSHGALFAQGCLARGMVKATYGTGSSIMMNIGDAPAFSDLGVVTSLAWSMNGKAQYVLEGNINYTGAVISWLKDDLKLIDNPNETQALAEHANPRDTTYLVPAFTGLGAPYWDSSAKASITGMTRLTGRNEIVRAALESIAYQIMDVIRAMRQTSGIDIPELRVDGGATHNEYLMQFQSDMLDIPVLIPDTDELSGIGAAYMAGLTVGLYDERVFSALKRKRFVPKMSNETRSRKYSGWQAALSRTKSR